VKQAADEYNRIAATAAKAGFSKVCTTRASSCSEVNGRRTYDILFELLDPRWSSSSSDVHHQPRFVAHEYFTKYPGRFNSMHLQTSI